MHKNLHYYVDLKIVSNLKRSLNDTFCHLKLKKAQNFVLGTKFKVVTILNSLFYLSLALQRSCLSENLRFFDELSKRSSQLLKGSLNSKSCNMSHHFGMDFSDKDYVIHTFFMVQIFAIVYVLSYKISLKKFCSNDPEYACRFVTFFHGLIDCFCCLFYINLPSLGYYQG